jgi:hypothetical protein
MVMKQSSQINHETGIAPGHHVNVGKLCLQATVLMSLSASAVSRRPELSAGGRNHYILAGL